ncbi:hypothetical protein B0I35DRAFT_453787 [Stachybotrys elegans]|uniref:Semialdehyde dehydrogenase dimerisation domain-containing protein n=1 Tax=Stachybotrys elegans TaxID=80388 RepID=A0A8K0SHT6_9HYPO|nr:hypothetical protein B0I35DRAFT_453787 [Stachybotrys elegans]
MIVRPCTPSSYPDCEIVFSGLDSSHYGRQKGFLVCNSNCAVVGIVVAFAALQKLGSIDQASVCSLQSISGAGYPGTPGLDILDNVIPYIAGEEEKIQAEACKILGNFQEDPSASIVNQSIPMAVACNRVAVLDGHLLCVSVRFTKRPAPTLDQVRAALKEYTSDAQTLGCFSAPKRAIPRLDRNAEGGFAVSIGRIRPDPSGVFDFMFVALSHNTILGAAGASIMNAEAAVMQGYV